MGAAVCSVAEKVGCSPESLRKALEVPMSCWWTMATIACSLVGTVSCSESTEPLTRPLTELSCTEAISRADDIYVGVFSMLANPSCSVDADCAVVGAQLVCEGFEHRQRPFAVHVSERELAESVLSERDELCGREAPVCPTPGGLGLG